MGFKTAEIGRFTFEVDADLYGRGQLADTLGLSACASDIDCIVAAYERWGRDCPRHLSGDFAFVADDHTSGDIFAARDHIGVRPLYYMLVDGKPRFATSIRDLAQGELPEIDEAVAAGYLLDHSFFSYDRTLLKGIRKVPPGHCLHWSEGDLRIEQYWHPTQLPELELRNDEEYVSRGREVFDQAVRDRSFPDRGGLGVHVSGGLDSSAIAALACKHRRESGLPDPVGFSWQMWSADSPSSDEAGWIAAMQAQLGIDVVFDRPTKQQALDLFKLDLACDYNVGNAFNESIVQEAAAKRDVTRILSGWGGDEFLTFNGRGLPLEYARTGQWRKLAGLTNSDGLRGVAKGLLLARYEKNRARKATVSEAKLAKTFLSEDILHRVEPPTIAPLSLSSARGTQLELLQAGHITARLEDWAEMGARTGIRYAFPMLDKRVMEFALSVPVHLFQRGNERRWLFREMMRGVLPESVRMNHSKQEPARVSDIKAATFDAMKEIGEGLGPPADYRRGRYIDVRRLKRELTSSDLENNGSFAHLRLALQFLDH
ncbi:MAG: asparagine synthase-related protein [Pseudomonadota bacterium]